MPDTVDTAIWADDGWRYRPKHVQQFADINKLYIVASCWIIIDTPEAETVLWMCSQNLLVLIMPKSKQIIVLNGGRGGGGGYAVAQSIESLR